MEENTPVQENETVSQDNFEHNAPDVNLQKMREAKEAETAARLEAEQRIAALEAQISQIQKPPEPVHDDVSDDDLVEWKDYKKTTGKIKELEQKFQDQQKITVEQQKIAAENAANARLMAEHEDYSKVMDEKNITKLVKSYPELAASLKNMTDPYVQHKAGYQMIKRFVYQEDTHDKEKERVQNNAQKPMPGMAVGGKPGDGPLTSAHLYSAGGTLTEEMKKELRRQNDIYRRGY